MKIFPIYLFLFICTTTIYSQNDITNTLGTGGLFYVKDATTNYLTITQSTGETNILKGLRLELTGSSSTTGVIFKGADRFMHDFKPTSADGYNTFLGINAGNFTMTASSSSQSSYNTGIGNNSLMNLTTGYYNTALGMNSLSSNTTGNNNTALGMNSLSSNTSGSYNTASGYYALFKNTTGNNNTASGFCALFWNTTGNDNTASGLYALYTNSTGYHNTASGFFALYSNTTGYYNTAIGYQAGAYVTTGSNLTVIGYNATASAVNATNEITLGDANITTLRCNAGGVTTLSDKRDKKNIKDLALGIDFLMQIKPRQFNWDRREWYENNISDGSKINNTPIAGFIAQELDEAQTSENVEWLNLVLKSNPERLEATSGNLLPIIVKAIQDLKMENNELKKVNGELKIRITKYEQIQSTLAVEIEKLKANSTEMTKVSFGVK